MENTLFRTFRSPFRATVLTMALLVSSLGHASEKRFETAEDWLLAATESWTPSYAIPLSKDSQGKVLAPGETVAEHAIRRRFIVAAVLRAAVDPDVPAVFEGKTGRVHGALLVLGIWNEESHFDLRVDRFHCAGLPKGSCDSGFAWCLGQVHPKDVPQLGYTGEEIQADPYKCARATLVRLAAAKAGTPKDAIAADRFCGYAIGHFESPCPLMRLRYQNMVRWAKKYDAPPPKS